MTVRGQHYSLLSLALYCVFIRRKERPRDIETTLKPLLRLQRLHLSDNRTAVDLVRATVFWLFTSLTSLLFLKIVLNTLFSLGSKAFRGCVFKLLPLNFDAIGTKAFKQRSTR